MKKLLVANWKMNLGASDSHKLALQIVKKSQSLKNCEVWLAPSFISIPSTQEACVGSPCLCGAQNVHWADNGAFTGEISGPMLKEAGVHFVIVGHSERRHVFFESDQEIINRAEAALRNDLTLVFCVGEKLEEREASATDDVLMKQLSLLPALAKKYPSSKIVIAYEPVWAIGTGKVASIAEINAAHNSIHSIYCELSGTNCPQILYGGSVAPDNFELISAQQLVAGALVGGASLSYEKFSALIDIAEAIN